MGNRFGQAYALTALSPICAGSDDDGISHDAWVRRELRELNTRSESPFAGVPTTHLARMVVIDDSPFEGIPARVDHLRSKYLLFTSNFDGRTASTNGKDDDAVLATYLESLRTGMSETIARLYRHCVDFPGVSDPVAFRDYFKRCQIKTSFFFGAYEDATVNDVLRALDLQRRFGAFVAEHQSLPSRGTEMTPETVQSAFSNFMATMREAPTPAPGTFL
jgi:hypothetical protein